MMTKACDNCYEKDCPSKSNEPCCAWNPDKIQIGQIWCHQEDDDYEVLILHLNGDRIRVFTYGCPSSGFKENEFREVYTYKATLRRE